MKFFFENSIASSENLFSDDFDLESESRVALTEKTFPTHFSDEMDIKKVYCKKKVKARLKVRNGKICSP